MDGIVYLSARHRSLFDLVQLIFEAFYESDEICKPTEAEIRRGLQDKQAFILLDDVHLTQDELDQVLDVAPRSAFAVATRERCLWGEVRSLPLQGLPVEDALLLLEREYNVPLDVTDRSAAATLCPALGGHPLRILQAAAIAREWKTSLDAWARDMTPENLIPQLMASIDDKQRRALLALTALPGVPLQVQQVSRHRGSHGHRAIAHDARPPGSGCPPTLAASASGRGWRPAPKNRGFEALGESRYHVLHRMGRTLPAQPGQPAPKNSEVLLRVQQHASDTRRWGEVVRLGQLLEGALVVGARWGAWAITLERCLDAARASGDSLTEAWALHEMGTRAVCLGEPRKARALLSQAVTLRESVE